MSQPIKDTLALFGGMAAIMGVLVALAVLLSSCAPSGKTGAPVDATAGESPYTVVARPYSDTEIRRYENATSVCFYVVGQYVGYSAYVQCQDKR